EGVRGSVRDLKRELRQAKHDAHGSRGDDWRRWVDPGWTPEGWADSPVGGPERGRPGRPTSGQAHGGAAEVDRKVTDLAAEVRRLLGLGRATPEDLRVASTVLDSVRDQLRHILRG